MAEKPWIFSIIDFETAVKRYSGNQVSSDYLFGAFLLTLLAELAINLYQSLLRKDTCRLLRHISNIFKDLGELQ